MLARSLQIVIANETMETMIIGKIRHNEAALDRPIEAKLLSFMYNSPPLSGYSALA